ncbi:MAG: bifunctional hydroxymethylpyrimidine kinase/phosphomethylpyrimidine kinase [Candidatus Amulumruptor caecigallinarius]|nr:bifunctional hydroxymethylpyrimidine kinase/phosphomethylpyrimidine kinase [Candidatus Amulumruptor caecigallinarius]MCM1396687.1 bifunctional hydroxymethylpyrimidine kinase/phosphomethylpyrimidine kinase [Candidatus Amulumruptor caecigallinarius]MCM1453255.1 bifunctional hydroxymethylpyrimidine kinase/phosphomethylpyrimidine kinase [bacterium]
MTNQRYITVLSIAGSDPVAGAGIQADIKSCMALGVYAMTAITAVTAQNTLGVRSFERVAPELVKAQIDAVCEDVRPDAVKIGMLPDAETVRTVTDTLQRHGLTDIVTDPVMVATSGDTLCSGDTLEALRELIGISTLVTPNLSEAATLSGIDIKSQAEVAEAAHIIMESTGCPAVLMKGGHATVDEDGVLTDTLYYKDTSMEIRHPFVESNNTHGTGCSLSSAIAACLAMDMPLQTACSAAVHWLAGAISAGRDITLGHGHGPVNHLYDPPQKFGTRNS